MFYKFTELVMVEGLYRIIQGIAGSQRYIFGRQQFAKQIYMARVSVDGLVALVKAGQPIDIMVAYAPQLNGHGPGRGGPIIRG